MEHNNVCISYGTENKEFADQLSHVLRQDGRLVCLYPYDFDYEFGVKHQDMIHSSDFFIILLSNKTITEIGALKQIIIAVENKTKIIQVLIGEGEFFPVVKRNRTITLKLEDRFGALKVMRIFKFDHGMRYNVEHNVELDVLGSNILLSPEHEVMVGMTVPQIAYPEDDILIRFVANTQKYKSFVESLLNDADPSELQLLGLDLCKWCEGVEVTVEIMSSSLSIHERSQTFKWNGKYKILNFDAKVKKDCQSKIDIKIDVFISGIRISKLRASIGVGSTGTFGSKYIRGAIVENAFASYDSGDSELVLHRISEISRNGVKVFVDCLSLRPGEEWKPALLAEICKTDTFLLFWSENASSSEWVEWEWRTALRERGLDIIEIHPLTTPDQAPPPLELNTLHFNDIHMLVKEAIAKKK